MLKEYLATDDMSVKEAMMQMNKTGHRVLFITNGNTTLTGSLTDGDIRRWVLKKGSLKGAISRVCHRDPVFVPQDYDTNKVKNLMLSRNIELVPVVDDKKRITGVLAWKDLFGEGSESLRKKLDMPVVIMAGGKGTRLDPFTKILPKALIPIGEKAIIDLIMERFSRYGINEFYVTLNHKAKMIKSYFEEMNTDYIIRYIEEDAPLGTAGSLRFLRGKIKDSVIVSNCDIIIDCDYSEIVDFHNSKNCDMTIVSSFRHFTIPYGICKIEKGGNLKAIAEKPVYDFLVNTGMYVLRNNTLELIPQNRMFHITDLAKSIKQKGGKVGVFPLNEKSWIDIGQWEEYRNSVRSLRLD